MRRSMSKFLLRLRSLFRRSQIEQELSDELRFQLEQQIEAYVRQGISREEGRYAAHRQLGRMEQIKEECRDARRINEDFNGKAELAKGQVATGAYFSTLGLTPAAGRLFTEEDDKARQQVAVLSYPFWQRRLGGDPSILGRTITLNQAPFILIGVTPPSDDRGEEPVRVIF